MIKKISLVLIFFLTLSACSESEDGSGTPPENESVNKLDYYLNCTNLYSEDIYEGFEDYLDEINVEVGPTGEEWFIGISPTYREIELCAANIQEANALNTESQLNELANTYLEALRTLHPLMVEADEYYTQEDYLNDGYAKGQELHEPLMEALNQFRTADNELREAIDMILDQSRQETLNKLEASGDEFNSLDLKLMREAKNLVHLGNVPNFAALELEAFSAALKRYETSLDEIKTYKKAKKDETGDFRTYAPNEDDYDDVLLYAKELMRAKRDGEAEDLEDERGYINDLVEYYNDLIEERGGVKVYSFVY